MIKKNLLLALATAAFILPGFADTISLSLTGDTSLDLWGAGSLAGAANSGYGGFPGTGAWPGPIQSPTGGDAYLYKLDNQNNAALGAGLGGPFPSGSGIYYGGFGTTPNTDGGTLGVADDTPVLDLQTVTFQIQIGQAFGYDLLDNDPSLITLYYTTNEGSGELSSSYSSLLNRFYNGSVDMPTGAGGAMQPEDIYVNLWGLQWDLSGISGITSFEIRFTGVEHASLGQLQLDQSSDAYNSSAFPQDAVWLSGGADSKWSTGGNWQDGNVSAAGQNVTLSGGTEVVLDADQTVGLLSINAGDGFAVDGTGGSVLHIVSGINGTSDTAASYSINADLHTDNYALIDLNGNSNLTIAGSVTGVGFYKQGEGSLSLAGANVFDSDNATLAANGIIIRGGTNYISGTNTLTGSNTINFNIRQDTTVVLHGGDDRLDSKFLVNLLAGTSRLVLGDDLGKSDLTVSGIAGSVGTAVVTGSQIAGGSSQASTLTVDVASGGSREFGGNLGGAGTNENNLAFTKKGAGTQILSGTNTYAGATRIENGLLQIGSATALSANSNVQLAGGMLGLASGNYSANIGSGAGEIQFLGNGGFAASGAARTVTLNGGSGLAWGSGGFVADGNKLILSHSSSNNTVDLTNAIDLGNQVRTVQVDNGSGSADARLSGVLSGTGGLKKTGTGTMELTAANTYSGETVVAEGILNLAGANGSVQGDVAVGAGATLQLTNTAAANNTDRLEDTAKVALNGSVLNFSNPTTGTTPAYSETIGELVLNQGANVITTSRAASGNTAVLTIDALTREKGATLNFTAGSTIGLDQRNSVVITGASNGFIGGWATAGNGFAAYGDYGVWAPSTTSSFYTTTAQNTWTASNNVYSSFAAGTQTLSGNRSVNSILTQGGTSGGGKLWDLNGHTLNVQSGGIITYSGNSSNTTKFNNGTLTAGTGNDAELFVTANGNTDIGATIADNGSGQVALVKAGSSTLTLTGTNTYSGGTYVNQGVLNINGTNNGGGSLNVAKNATVAVNGTLLVGGTLTVDGTLGGTGTLSFAAGTTLGGSGVVNYAVTVGSAAGQLNTLSPGNSPGTQTFGATQTWADGGTYVWELADVDAGAGTGWDAIHITGALDITLAPGDDFTIQIVSLDALHDAGLVADFNELEDYSWTILTASGGISGFDADLFTLNLSDFENVYSGSFSLAQNGNSINLVYNAEVIPEPSTYAMLGLGLLALLFLRRGALKFQHAPNRS